MLDVLKLIPLIVTSRAPNTYAVSQSCRSHHQPDSLNWLWILNFYTNDSPCWLGYRGWRMVFGEWTPSDQLCVLASDLELRYSTVWWSPRRNPNYALRMYEDSKANSSITPLASTENRPKGYYYYYYYCSYTHLSACRPSGGRSCGAAG